MIHTAGTKAGDGIRDGIRDGTIKIGHQLVAVTLPKGRHVKRFNDSNQLGTRPSKYSTSQAQWSSGQTTGVRELQFLILVVERCH